jgi:hypothetical protein
LGARKYAGEERKCGNGIGGSNRCLRDKEVCVPRYTEVKIIKVRDKVTARDVLGTVNPREV